MNEIYTALHANSRRLALMGTRALVDLYMCDTVGDAGGFETKLKKLVEDRRVPLEDRKILFAALEAGHAASHRGHNPEVTKLERVLDIVENLLQKVALRSSIEKLNDSVPPRRK